MGVETAIIAGAVTAGVGTAATIVSSQKQAEAARRAQTRARGIADEERRRQAEIKAAQDAETKSLADRQGAILRATAGKGSGRRSLISGSELGAKDILG